MTERGGFGQRRGGFRGRSERGESAPKPVEMGKEYDVDIQEISRRGEGVARIEGLVIFVPNAKQGQHVKIRVTRISGRFAEGEVIGEVEPQESTEDKQ